MQHLKNPLTIHLVENCRSARPLVSLRIVCPIAQLVKFFLEIRIHFLLQNRILLLEELLLLKLIELVMGRRNCMSNHALTFKNSILTFLYKRRF